MDGWSLRKPADTDTFISVKYLAQDNRTSKE